VAAGLDLNGVDPGVIKLTNQGQPVPIAVDRPARVNRARFGPGWYIEFLGEPQDTLYTKTNVYALHLDRRDALRVAVDSRSVGQGQEAAGYYMETVHVEPELLYSFSAPNGDPWYAADLLANGKAFQRDFEVVLDDYAGVVAPVTLDIGVWGAIDWPDEGMDHHLVVSLNGSAPLADEWFDGMVEHVIRLEVPAGLAREGSNSLRLRLPLDTGFAFDKVNLNYYAITYPRVPLSRDGGRLTARARGQVLEAKGFNSPDIRIYRQGQGGLTRVQGLRTSQDADGSYAVRFPGIDTDASYHIVTDGALLAPEVEPVGDVEDILQGAADYLVITHPIFHDANLDRLLETRQAEGYSVKVATTDAVYAAFSYGVRDAEAIRDYIRYAYNHLGTRLVLLVGGDTMDYHNYQGAGAYSFLPSIYAQTDARVVRFAPVDPLYADVERDDGVPDLGIGRFPVRTAEELRVLVDKTLQYGQFRTYARRSVFSADHYDSAKQYDFRRDSDLLIEGLPAGWQSGVIRSYIDELGVAGAKDALKRSIADGVSLVSFVGHSSSSQWSISKGGALFTQAEVAALGNVGKPTLVTQWGCWNNWHVAVNTQTMGHKFLVAGAQGAAAVLGSATLTDASHERALGQRLYRWLFEPGMTIGDAMTLAKQEHALAAPADADVLLGWTLLGDPALALEP
jgi:hypothetical protein